MSGMGIGSVGSYSQALSPANASNQVASGKRINSAADDAAGLAIAEKLDSQSTGAAAASDNAKDMSNLLNLSDGALGQISEGLDRMRELAVQSQNAIYTDSDKAAFQQEIDGILENINDIAKNTQYNGKTVLDGSFTAQNAMIGPNGESMEINIGSMVTDELGISGFNVMGSSVDLKALDNAIETVATERSNIGAYTSRLESSARVTDNMSYNMEVSRSRIEDADIAKAAMDNSKNKALEETQVAMQKLKMDGMGNFLQMIG